MVDLFFNQWNSLVFRLDQWSVIKKKVAADLGIMNIVWGKGHNIIVIKINIP
jgi:hypothetical protein